MLLMEKAVKKLQKSEIYYLTLAIILNLIIRLFTLHPFTWTNDEFCYLTGAQELSRGEVLYRDFGDIKPPLIFYIYLLFLKIFGVSEVLTGLKIGILVLTTINIFLFWLILRETSLPLHIKGAGVLIFALFLTAGKNGQFLAGNTEIYSLPFLLFSLWLFWKWREEFHPLLIFPGFLLALSSLVNTKNLLLFPALLSFVGIREGKNSIKKVLFLSLGFSLPFLYFLIYFWSRNALGDFYLWQVKWASIYSRQHHFKEKWINTFRGFAFLKQWYLLYFFILVYLGNLLFARERRKISNLEKFVLSLLFLSLLARSFTGKKALRYYILLYPFLVQISCFGIARFFSFKSGRGVFAGKILLTFSLIFFSLYHWEKNLYRNFLAIRNFNPDHVNNNPFVRYIISHSTSRDKIFVWDEGDFYYFLTQRPMATSFWSPMVVLVDESLWRLNKYKGIEIFWERFFKELKRDSPLFILDYKNYFCTREDDGEIIDRYQEKLLSYVRKHYEVVLRKENVILWKRKERRNG